MFHLIIGTDKDEFHLLSNISFSCNESISLHRDILCMQDYNGR